MALERRSLGDAGLRYLSDYLSGGVTLAASALKALETPGETFTYLPPDSPTDVALAFGSARALHPAHAHANPKEWGKAWTDPSYSACPSGREPLVGEVVSALSRPSAVLRIQSDVSPLLVVHAPASSDDLQSALVDSYVMGTFVAVVTDDRGRVVFVAIEAYDGEGFVAWRSSEPEVSV